MKKKIIYGFLFLVLSYFVWKTYQFNQIKSNLPSRKSLIQKELDLRLIRYQKNFNKKCVESYLQEAQEIADSIVFIRANELMLFDSLSRPPKPDKPIIPTIIPLNDSVQVEPLMVNDSTEN